jgi:hypothetical protein
MVSGDPPHSPMCPIALLRAIPIYLHAAGASRHTTAPRTRGRRSRRYPTRRARRTPESRCCPSGIRRAANRPRKQSAAFRAGQPRHDLQVDMDVGVLAFELGQHLRHHFAFVTHHARSVPWYACPRCARSTMRAAYSGCYGRAASGCAAWLARDSAVPSARAAAASRSAGAVGAVGAACPACSVFASSQPPWNPAFFNPSRM